MAQCYTQKNKLPKTQSAYDYRLPKLESHHKRPAVRFDPQWGGRQNYPGCTVLRPFIDRPEISFHPPLFEAYREKRMAAMLKQINFCNWTGSQNVQTGGKREKPLDVNELPKTKTTYREFFKDNGPQPVAESYAPIHTGALGAIPGLYSVRPHVDHPLYIRACDPVTSECLSEEQKLKKGQMSSQGALRLPNIES